jgi:hypothetical protein
VGSVHGLVNEFVPTKLGRHPRRNELHIDATPGKRLYFAPKENMGLTWKLWD